MAKWWWRMGRRVRQVGGRGQRRHGLVAAVCAAGVVVGSTAGVLAGAVGATPVSAVLPPEASTGCTGDVPVVVASDVSAQSDLYSAVTLAGVAGTDCVILAGDRSAPMPAIQQARLDAAAAGGFVVGGLAAVPEHKVAGRGLVRVAGSDRWHTARLVGFWALRIAGGDDAAGAGASAGAEHAAADCTGDVPIVVASDAAAESDRYSAVTLAGVVGTDCVIVAGARDAPMPAAQQLRLNAAATGGFVVGGLAAVPEHKVAGRALVRVAGSDRWHTARLVGLQARRIAAETATTDLDPDDPAATSLAGDYRLAYSTADTTTADSYGWGNHIWMVELQGSREAIGSYSNHGGARPVFSPDGRWVAYGANGKGYVMGTDGRNVREVRTQGRWSYNFRWSPDSRHLVYNPAAGLGSTSWIERSDGENKRSIGLFWRFSPDSKLALYSIFDEIGDERVYSHTVVEDLDSGIQVTIDVDESNSRYVEFTPNSRKVSWQVQNPNGVEQDLWTMDIDGSNKVKLLTAGFGNLPGSAKTLWSPDGSRFAYVRGYGIGTQFLVADASNGETIMNLGISKCNYLDWAPDGVHLISDNREGFVFNTTTGDTIRQRDLYTRDSSYGRILNVRWSPDNQSIAYILEETDLDNPVVPSDVGEQWTELWTDPYFPISTQLWVADADGQNQRKLVDNVGHDFRWSPDGSRIAYSTLMPLRFDEGGPLPRSTSALWIMDSDGNNRWSVASHPEYGRIELLGWVPN